MVLFIDGHNLISKIPGLALGQPDDEAHLIEILQEYARISRAAIEIFFDKASPGFSGKRTVGTLKVHYVPEKTTADEAIIRRVQSAEKRSKEITVVSSDHHVQNQVKALGAKTLTSDQFSKDVIRILQKPIPRGGEQSAPKLERPLNDDEVAEWMKLFNSGPSEKYSE